ncbi:hypothetical protein GCM10027294_09070 [Marinactinospora endophytica]
MVFVCFWEDSRVEQVRRQGRPIAGGGSGLGRATALQVAREGAKPALVDLNEEGLAEAAAAVKRVAPQAEVTTIVANVAAEDGTRGYVDKTIEVYGRIDAFSGNAGIEGGQDLTQDFGARSSTVSYRSTCAGSSSTSSTSCPSCGSRATARSSTPPASAGSGVWATGPATPPPSTASPA